MALNHRTCREKKFSPKTILFTLRENLEQFLYVVVASFPGSHAPEPGNEATLLVDQFSREGGVCVLVWAQEARR